MSEQVEIYGAIKDHKKALRAKYGVNCPQCATARPKAPPSILLPQQRCRVDGFRDQRPELTNEQWSNASAPEHDSKGAAGDPVMMTVGVWYVATKASADGEFRVGDRISLNADGSINNREVCGWMDASDVAAATRGMEIEIDKQWIERRKQRLLADLVALEAANGNDG